MRIRAKQAAISMVAGRLSRTRGLADTGTARAVEDHPVHVDKRTWPPQEAV